jgi:hypothetical protein
MGEPRPTGADGAQADAVANAVRARVADLAGRDAPRMLKLPASWCCFWTR